MITGIYLHDPPPFKGPFFMTPPFSESQKVVSLPLFPPPPPLPLLISGKSLSPPGYRIHQSGCKTNVLVKVFSHFSFVLNMILVFFQKSGLTLIVKNDARRRELFFSTLNRLASNAEVFTSSPKNASVGGYEQSCSHFSMNQTNLNLIGILSATGNENYKAWTLKTCF